ncbi:MAG: formylglycine-generating enzyme family protein [Kofleriaceae bacterium]|jgi:sulfatase modifying factor 1|nr:formylglycine-generating enzyme family protein [Kofleriaceae bacterium]MBP6835937.1 formylglycine-generating enzyme family protein [Kofleriaceae bacterium]MBP9203032.1 formylglycine-generating enzyme family protein [Kofleriaceae bacterium]
MRGGRVMAGVVHALLAFGLLAAPAHGAPSARARLRRSAPMVTVGPGTYRPMFPAAPAEATVAVRAFRLDVYPVTNRDFLAFVLAAPRWQRGAASGLFVDSNYLTHWAGPRELGSAGPDRPVTRVSWFAAKAFCEAHGQRLPTEREWELAAAASPTSVDGDLDEAWRTQVLDWYHAPTAALGPVGRRPANLWGVHDLHGLVWEWVYDYNAALVAIDSREKSDGDKGRFCGAGAAFAADTTDFAEFMRLAYRSSLEGGYAANNLGFRCARDLDGAAKHSPRRAAGSEGAR